MDAPVLHILIDDDGIPRTINHRVKVKMIAQKHLIAGETFQEIADHYGLQLSDVYAALTYYYDNREQMDADSERAEALLKEIGVSGAELKAKIQQRMQAKKADE